jgi:hypothetical protein
MNRLLKAARVYIYRMEKLVKARNIDAIILVIFHCCTFASLIYCFHPLSKTSLYSSSGFRKQFHDSISGFQLKSKVENAFIEGKNIKLISNKWHHGLKREPAWGRGGGPVGCVKTGQLIFNMGPEWSEVRMMH